LEEGLTQAQLAAHSGVSSGTVNRLANGSRTAAPRTCHKLVKALCEIVKKNFSFEDVFPNTTKY